MLPFTIFLVLLINSTATQAHLRGFIISDTYFTASQLGELNTSIKRNLRGPAEGNHNFDVQPSRIIQWARWTIEYPIETIVKFLFPTSITMPYYNDDNQQYVVGYLYDESLIEKSFEKHGLSIQNDHEVNSTQAILATDDDVDSDTNKEVGYHNADDDNLNYLVNDDDNRLYLIDYYYDQRLLNDDDYNLDAWLEGIPASSFTQIDGHPPKDNIHEMEVETEYQNVKIVPPSTFASFHLRGSSITHPHVNTCPCIIPDHNCNPDDIVCPLNYDPVCGCDNSTYSNACEARYFGCNRSWKPGKCHGNLRASN